MLCGRTSIFSALELGFLPMPFNCTHDCFNRPWSRQSRNVKIRPLKASISLVNRANVLASVSVARIEEEDEDKAEAEVVAVRLDFENHPANCDSFMLISYTWQLMNRKKKNLVF
jgi:hypothetical protein